MEKKRNYQIELENIIKESNPDNPPTLLLHACCAPCSSYCLEYLAKYFKVTVFYYNPNIAPAGEYRKRVDEEKRLIAAYNAEIIWGERQGNPIGIREGDYEPRRFYEAVRGLENLGEGSERCFKCFELRLRKTAMAVGDGYDYFTTTLTISPLKNAEKLNEIGERIAGEYGLNWLPSDFKKKDGYKRSIELSQQYGLYRQDYCGCLFSQSERNAQRAARGELPL
ncbi:MAG: epoxyqueuosine reductase QueH [Lachnospiraceae bacterium]|nr:epoxyqueuosine reductase QueH [Lachnospiraceae bacterium]